VCPAGTYSARDGWRETSRAEECTPCPLGTSSNEVGATNGDVCKLCETNTFAAGGATSCTPCAVAFISGMGAGECRPDPEAQGIPFHYYVLAGALLAVAGLSGLAWMKFQQIQARNEVEKYKAPEGADEAEEEDEEEEEEIEEVGEEDEASRVEKALKNKIKKSKRKNQK